MRDRFERQAAEIIRVEKRPAPWPGGGMQWCIVADGEPVVWAGRAEGDGAISESEAEVVARMERAPIAATLRRAFADACSILVPTEKAGETMHYMGDYLLPLCGGPGDEDGQTRMSPVPEEVTCTACRSALRLRQTASCDCAAKNITCTHGRAFARARQAAPAAPVDCERMELARVGYDRVVADGGKPSPFEDVTSMWLDLVDGALDNTVPRDAEVFGAAEAIRARHAEMRAATSGSPSAAEAPLSACFGCDRTFPRDAEHAAHVCAGRIAPPSLEEAQAVAVAPPAPLPDELRARLLDSAERVAADDPRERAIRAVAEGLRVSPERVRDVAGVPCETSHKVDAVERALQEERAMADVLRRSLDDLDIRLTRARNALTAASVPDLAEVPGKVCGRALSVAERIEMLAAQREAAYQRGRADAAKTRAVKIEGERAKAIQFVSRLADEQRDPARAGALDNVARLLAEPFPAAPREEAPAGVLAVTMESVSRADNGQPYVTMGCNLPANAPKRVRVVFLDPGSTLAGIVEAHRELTECEHTNAAIQGGAVLWCIDCGAFQPWNNGPAGRWQRPRLAVVEPTAASSK